MVMLLVLGASTHLISQNLVNNYSLENYSSCPNGASAIPQAISWNAAKNSPEYLHSCSSGIYSDTPTNYFGYQVPAHGQAYGGGLFYGSFLSSYLADLREYFYVTLSSPMVVGQTYYVQFKINLVDNSPYAINRAGVQFVTTYNSNYPFQNNAHVYTNTVISDKTNWTTVFGTFVPTVAYTALNIGNFFTDANCTVQFVGTSVAIGYHSYCFIDECYVSTVPPVVLNVKWNRAEVEVAGNIANLTWDFEGEDVDFYQLEHSDDGHDFAEGQKIKAIDGQQAYAQKDTLHSHMPTSFYRIRAIMKDGNTHLSQVIEAKRFEAGIDFLIAYPSPVKQDELLTVEYNSTTGQAAEVQIIGIDGRLVRTEIFPETDPGHHELKLSVQGLAAGAYILKAGSLTRKFMVAE
jgi:hypothetical protein